MSARLEGRAASPGAALAPAFVVAPRRRDAGRTGPKGTPDEERARATEALERTATELEGLADRMADTAGEEEAAIFTAHAAFAADPELADRIAAATADGARAEQAVRVAFDSFRELLAASDNEYLAARAADLDDVRDQVLDVLTGAAQAPVPTERSVVVATELTPSQTTRLPRELIAAIACEAGSATSHAAILARSLGIPAVVGVPGLVGRVSAGDALAVDGDAGTVLIDPDEVERGAVTSRTEAAAERDRRLRALRDEPGRTADGTRVELAANVNDAGALEAALEFGAEGSGLVRTEFLFLEATEPPTVDEQASYYRTVLDAFGTHRVVIRTMDIGADKPLPFVRREPEENPALGVRGLRLGLAVPELLRDQLRALLRAGAGSAAQLAIMFPLVATPGELIRARAVLDDVVREEDADMSDVEVGVMIEVPAAALGARRMARQADFLSIGTNDLLQYLFAADRLQAEVADLPDLLDPDVLRLLAAVVDAGHDEGAWIGVCGEAAADPVSAAALVGLGVDELSMTPRAIPEVKDLLRRVRADDLAAAADEAKGAGDAEQARATITVALPR